MGEGTEVGELAELGVEARGARELESKVLQQVSSGDASQQQTTQRGTAESELARIRKEEKATRDNLAQLHDQKLTSHQHAQLQRRVSEQRLQGLQQRRQQLEEQINSAGPHNQSNQNAYPPHTLGLPTDQTRPQATQSVASQKQQPVLQEADDLDLSLQAGQSVETERDRLIRTGQLTPFDNLDEQRTHLRALDRYKQKEADIEKQRNRTQYVPPEKFKAPMNKPLRGFMMPSSRSGTKRAERVQQKQFRANLESYKRAAQGEDVDSNGVSSSGKFSKQRRASNNGSRDQENLNAASEAESSVKAEQAVKLHQDNRISHKRARSNLEATKVEDDKEEESFEEEHEAAAEWDGSLELDGSDSDEATGTKFQNRSRKHSGAASSIGGGRSRKAQKTGEANDVKTDDEAAEREANLEDREPADFEGGFKVPGRLWESLFVYQRTGIQWLWELHCQKVGGIVGDEMGLGKTITVLTFLSALQYSGLYTPSLVLCPATMLRQWQYELKQWAPNLRIGILHDSAVDADMAVKLDGDRRAARLAVLDDIRKSQNGVLLTTYEHLRVFADTLLDVRWGYVVLDEGHRIRNPDAQITIQAKQVKTPHRLIMSGAPIQNRLSELWSLFDFIFPGRLGTLPVFQSHFAVPIQMGGYKRASGQELSTAYRCAVMLRDMISPYILRRMKADVDCVLPDKKEEVLFCPLTHEQREQYRSYINSAEVQEIMSGNRELLQGLDVLKKISNHPDLLDRVHTAGRSGYGSTDRSGKLLVAEKLFKLWHSQGHRCLVFSQTQQMLDILELLSAKNGLTYRRMDGSTPVGKRSKYIDTFNNDENVFAFLLTTRVGGYGINLTGADRVLIFDPDWNPSTDAQARERAWRIGQSKNVAIYRLITKGTIDEKVYHRQLYKQFLTNKVLQDPKQRKFFSAKQLGNLFSLDEEQDKHEGDSQTVHDEAQKEAQAAETPEQKDGKITQDGLEGKGDENDKESADDSVSKETGLLQNLFENKGIHGTMDHDAIMKASDPSMRASHIREAERVAQDAAEKLKKSSKECRQQDVYIPTWTGKSGTSGIRSNSVDFAAGSSQTNIHSGPWIGQLPAVSSQALLQYLNNRHESTGPSSMSGCESSSSRGNESDSQLSGRAQSLAEQLCEFLKAKGNEATSATLLHHFDGKYAQNEKALFKQVLQQVAKLHKRADGYKTWKLRSEFANAC